jgi:hypothetical protein
MLKFNASNIEELQEEVKERAHEVSIAIVTSIILALEQDVDNVEIGSVAGGGLSIAVKCSDFLKALELNLKRCQEAEEYELCAKAVDWMAKLSA